MREVDKNDVMGVRIINDQVRKSHISQVKRPIATYFFKKNSAIHYL